ncbi:hypothetical protein [Alteromonas stellipolaris]|uniref:YD repeat-containing protein n=1 Tax=Alteromonas stellipolaris TaxID=233316 RepID=A0AAW7Z090_9ALTE|nr:hypothetical protein [Alteromonas stellipolaris]ANB25316.1 hypothetical protein A6F57_08960 [Alteromonas stellipolaris]MDO6533624.1 hypothetical protein [Alteromonas stellipolaris]MDO6576854.1 hypothetical protein [Alteromonas stellipolaris]MDO6625382.1 hypothetical protein [Alteromonas stellipolaris]
MFFSKMKKVFLACLIIILVAMNTQLHAQVTSDQGLKLPARLTPTDTANVDVLSGKPSLTLQDLSIGSGIGKIDHMIQTPVEGFYWGFRDSHKFSVQVFLDSYGQINVGGRAVTLGLQTSRFISIRGELTPLDMDGSKLDEISLSGRKYEYQGSNGEVLINNNPTTTYIEPTGLTWTRYENTDSQGRRVEIVINNAGFALVYQYSNADTDNRPCYTSRPNSAKPHCGDNVKDERFPVKLTAVNASICNPSDYTCYSKSHWPAVSYQWPWAVDVFGYEGYGSNASYFTVTDNHGRRARYTQERLFSKSGENNLNREWNAYEIGPHGILPQTRITKFEPFESNGVATHTFEYEDFISCVRAGSFGEITERCTMRQMIIKEANINGSIYTYNHTKPNTIYRDAGRSVSSDGRILNVTMNTGFIPTLAFGIYTHNETASFYEDYANNVKTLSVDGVKTEYKYDTRQNLVKVTSKSRHGNGNDLVKTAEYPSDCNNLKVCNKPTWVADAKGNKTHYTYHSKSGQVESVTRPPANNGVSPQTRYKYQQYYANYYSQSGNKVRATRPIWLIKEESYCIKGKPKSNGNGCTMLNDEVKTTYTYGTDNLHLTSILVTARNETRLTCMEYDQLGNQTGLTSPKGVNLTCN